MVSVHFFKLSAKKKHANPTIFNKEIKEIHILTVGGVSEFPILSHVLLRCVNIYLNTRGVRWPGG